MTEITNSPMATIDYAIRGLEKHLSEEHENPISSASQLDTITRSVLYQLEMDPLLEDKANYILGLYGKAMEVLLEYDEQSNGDDRFIRYAETINTRFVNLTQLRDGLPLTKDVDVSLEAIHANIALARDYREPSEP